MVHIVLLAKVNKNAKSRVWADFSCAQECCDYICRMFEEKLKRENPTLPEITYDITDLYDFVDRMPDLCCMISRDNNNVYVGHNKEWLKVKLFFALRRYVNVEEI